ncbi:MAG: glycosyltransferase family 4 protein [Nanoarchaeota archaeon]
MKKILFTIKSNSKIHKLWKNFLLFPPDGFEYVDCNCSFLDFSKVKNVKETLKSKIINILYKIKRRIPLMIYLYNFSENKRFSRYIDTHNPDLIYCINGKIYYGNKPWVVDFENPSVFFDYNLKAFKKYIKKNEEILSRENCKAIIAYSEEGKKSFLANFTSEKIKSKVCVIPNVIYSPKNVKKIEHNGFNILFTGTSNLEDDFYSRGGKEVVHVFIKLSKKYQDIKLIIRCKVPKKEKELLKGKNVEIYENILSKKEFDALFLKSDLYLFPAYVGYALSVLEAMGFGLPVITSDLLENGEPVEDTINGFKVKPKKIKYVLPLIPDYFFKRKPTFILDHDYVNGIVEKVEFLYNRPELCKKISENNINKVRKNYNIVVKNKILGDIFKNN